MRSAKHPVLRVSVAAVFLALLAGAADAHHIRGIPHYAYTEGYPHAPAFEEGRTAGPFEMRFTFFMVPGGKKADFALYVKDTRTGKPYEGDVTMAVYAQSESAADAHGAGAYRNKNNIYKVGWVYEEEDVYCVRTRFGEGADATEETFRIQVGEPKVNTTFLGVVAGAVVTLVVVVGILNRNRSTEKGKQGHDEDERVAE